MTKINTKPRLTGYQIAKRQALFIENIKAKLFDQPKVKAKFTKDEKVRAFIHFIRRAKSNNKSIDYVFKSLKSFEEDYFGPAPKVVTKKTAVIKKSK